jgi:hypothetical protein
VYNEDATDVRSVTILGPCFKGGEKDTGNWPRSGQPATAVAKETKGKVHVLNRNIAATGISKAAVMAIIRERGYRNVCTKWVSKIFTVEHKRARKNICAEVLQRNETDGDVFLSRIITGDITWVHRYDPLTKRQSTEWHRQPCASRKTIHRQASPGKVTASVFWNSEELCS